MTDRDPRGRQPALPPHPAGDRPRRLPQPVPAHHRRPHRRLLLQAADRPRAPRRYSEGLVGLSACLGGEIPKALEAEDWDLARQVAGEYRDILGKDRFFLELQDHGMPEQHRLNEQLLRLAPEVGPAAGRDQRPPLRPSRAARGARRPAVRRDRQQPRHAQPDEVRDARLLPQDRGRDGGAVPGPAGGAPQHAPDRRHVRPRAAAGRAADPALPGARRRDRRDLAAQGVRGGPGAALRRDHARSSRSGSTTSWA